MRNGPRGARGEFCPEIRQCKKKKVKRSGSTSCSFIYFILERFFLVCAVNATAHKVRAAIAPATEMSAAMLKSGTLGVEVVVEAAEL